MPFRVIGSNRLDRIYHELTHIRQAVNGLRDQLTDTDRADRVRHRRMQGALMATVQDIRDEVAVTRGTVDSATLLIRRLVDEVAANVEDPVALQAIVDDIRLQREDLAEAVASEGDDDAGTGTPPTPEPELA